MRPDTESDPRVGTTIDGRYTVVARLAAGAMGVVYRGEHTELRRAVAIKFLNPLLVADPTFADRFRREALTMSKVDHPNCVSVIDMGIADAPYIVMDFVRGVSLADLIEDEAPDPRRAIGIVCQVLAALEHAHDLGIIHRDIKPANVMLDEHKGTGDHVRILDFGLAKFRDVSGEHDTISGVVVGTPSYMAPEQAAGGQLDARSDIYSTGVLLFQLLTGDKPFHGETYELIRKHIEAPPPRLRDVGDDREFSRELEDVVARTLAKAPALRPQTAGELADALRGVPEMTGDAAQPARTRTARPARDAVVAAPPPPHTTRPARRGRWVVAAAVIAVVAAVLLWTPVGEKLFRETRERAGDVLGSRSDAGTAAQPVETIEDARALAARDVDGAIRALHELRRADPDNGDVYKALGDLYFDKQWAAEGLAAYREALARKPALRDDRALLGNTVASLGDPATTSVASDIILGGVGDAALPALRRAARNAGDATTRERAAHLARVLSAR